MTETTKTKVASWIRVSTKEQQNQRQIQDLKEYYKKQEWTWDEELIYKSKETAFITKKRHDFNKLMEIAKQQKFNILVFWSYDRLSREGIRETLNIVSQFTTQKITLNSYSEQYINESTEDFKDILIALRSWIAWQESRNTSKRVKSGMNNKNTKGLPQNKPPYGYKTTKKGYIIDKTKEQTIKQIYQQYNNQTTITQISKNTGINTKKIQYILQNKSYCGYIKYKGQYTKTNHEPIITIEQYQQTQQKTEQQKKINTKNKIINLVQ